MRLRIDTMTRYNNTGGGIAVFAWQSGHRATQRDLTAGLDGVFPLLRVYERASTRWHELRSQASKVVSQPKDTVDVIAATRTFVRCCCCASYAVEVIG